MSPDQNEQDQRYTVAIERRIDLHLATKLLPPLPLFKNVKPTMYPAQLPTGAGAKKIKEDMSSCWKQLSVKFRNWFTL